MTPSSNHRWNFTDAQRWPLMIFAAFAIAFGLYGRFVGLGLWPLGVDEFYISRSIDNILRTGLPQFMCGGYYTRGVIYQYAVAGLRIEGATPEFAGRIVSALSSLITLPGVYLLARRLRGPVAGLLAVCVLALSIWEIEMARFARMYAPFQAVFVWYLVFFLQYTVDAKRRALIPMIALSLLGVALWEGGALIGVINLLPPFINNVRGRLARGSWLYLIGMGTLLAILYLSTLDLRGFAELPPGYVESGVGAPQANWLFQTLNHHRAWELAFVIPILFAALNTPWLWSMRQRWLTALGLAAAIASMLVHQLMLGGGIIVLLLAGRFIDWRELCSPSARYLWLTLIATTAFWILFGHFVEPELGGKLPMLIHQLLGFPDVLEKIGRPWVRSIPLSGLLLTLAFAGLLWHSISGSESEHNRDDRALLIVVTAVILTVGAASMERLETRYTFFLYPALIVIAIAASTTLIAHYFRNPSTAAVILCLLVLGTFAITEDFKPHHVLTVDSAATNFRHGMRPFERDHYYPRNDIRATAEWLAAHVRPGDVVISSVPSLAAYYPQVESFFMDDNDPRYEAYVCNNGHSERWSNLPLIYSSAALERQVTPAHRIFLVNYHGVAPRTPAATDIHVEQLSSSEDQGTDIYLLTRS